MPVLELFSRVYRVQFIAWLLLFNPPPVSISSVFFFIIFYFFFLLEETVRAGHMRASIDILWMIV